MFDDEIRADADGILYKFDPLYRESNIHLEKIVEWKDGKFYGIAEINPETGDYIRKFPGMGRQLVEGKIRTLHRLDTVDGNCRGFYMPNGNWLISAIYDPWTGDLLEERYSTFSLAILWNDFIGKTAGNEYSIKEKVLEFFQKSREQHLLNRVCNPLYDLVIGIDSKQTRAAYFPMIRCYGLWKEWYKEDDPRYDFTIMNYCPFCGAKLPERLDEKLTEILQKEYGLNSWKDYKKAPHEFHTDEWWRKRGL